MSVETLRAVNGIGASSRVPVGHMLLVPSERPTREAAETLAQAVFTTVPAGRTFYYTARRGDTLQRISARYGVTAQEIKTIKQQNLRVLGQVGGVGEDVLPGLHGHGAAVIAAVRIDECRGPVRVGQFQVDQVRDGLLRRGETAHVRLGEPDQSGVVQQPGGQLLALRQGAVDATGGDDAR